MNHRSDMIKSREAETQETTRGKARIDQNWPNTIDTIDRGSLAS